jgi:hypothetical protein
MTAADQTDEIARRADALYAARSAIAETNAPPRRLGIAELMQFLDDPGRTLTMEEQRALFADPKLRADFRRLKAQAAVAELPALAAAGTGDVTARRFEDPSRVRGQIYVILRFAALAGTPRMMLLESAAGDLLKRALPAADPTGEVMIVLDERSDTDAGFLRLLSDPTATGTFVS